VHVRWYGQSAFALAGGGKSVFIDPFGDMESARARGMTWNYPAIMDATADLLVVTHEHGDHKRGPGSQWCEANRPLPRRV
jgi:L-ascorbate metabolism protein UlaG (beta-lactamase superfamily)